MILNLLTQNEPFEPTIGWYITVAILALLCIAPWIGLIIYSFTKKFRIRFYDNNILVDTKMLKKNEDIVFPALTKEGYEVAGWYLDQEFTKKFVETKMVPRFLKVYVKWSEKNV